ncbi:hypothetical protein [Komagataeibacter xylinus]|nr:hypothetical protein [Komagataeibacter xylinus]
MLSGWVVNACLLSNAKLVQPIGQSSSVSAYFDWSDLHELEYAGHVA